jgi:general secretion pathway protein D
MRLVRSIVRLTDRTRPHVAMLVVIASISVGAALAEQAASPLAQSSATGEALIAMNFPDVELRTVIKFISEVTGYNFVFDDRVRGKITIVAPQKMSVYQAYAAFQSALYIAGFTTVPSGAVIKIVPVQEAKSSAIETVGPGDAAVRNDMIVTELLALKNVHVKNILPIVQPLVSPDGIVVAYAATNTLVIVDSAANVNRIHDILDALDVPESRQQLEVLRLRNTSVTELAPVLQQVLDQ